MLIAREKERQEIQRWVDSYESQFIIVYGRRRIGKTYLVEQHFEGKFDFKYVGAHNMRTKNQLANFARALQKYSGKPQGPFEDWYEAFWALENYLENIPDEKRKIIFIDEMPWMDTSRSDFVSALENFWNGWAAHQYNIVLIATGSSTSWMVDKLIKNRGGLYNRIRGRIHLRPFNLNETEQYLQSQGCPWDRFQIVQCYMLTGGVPYYLKLLDYSRSVAQNIDELCFNETGALHDEFMELYNAVFPGADSYTNVVRLLSEHRDGMTREEISKKTKLTGAFLTKVLHNLERNSFIGVYNQFGGKKNQLIYRLTDYYTLFYFKFLDGNREKNEHWWTQNMDTPKVHIWQGLSFEIVCMDHHAQIKQSLGISGISTSISCMRCQEDKENDIDGFQIDLILDRADRIINLCEIKFSQEPYSITKPYDMRLRNRLGAFIKATKTKKAVVYTFVTTYGVANASRYSIVHSQIKMDDLFNH